ncbi:MAG TPA: tetratricopeptide repeat protein [Pyrinomonadaceae bacterium]|nr:tetratricopeptide repeat protein [Pyrinomonadaceae bacterium]
MKKVFLLLLLSLSVSAQTQTPDPIASLREQIQGASTAPERNRLRLKLADLLLTEGQKSEAVAELQEIAGSSDFDPIGFYNLGNFFARLGDSDAAITAYRSAIDQRKGQYSRAYNNLGVVLLRAGRWDEAQDALLSALKLETFRYAEASYNLGRVYAARGQKDLAIREWRRALAVDPRHDAAAQALAGVGNEDRIVVKAPSAKAPRNAEPKKSVPAAVPPSAEMPFSLDETSFDLLQHARNASERGKVLEAVENYRRVLKREGGYFAPANLELSFALISLKRNDEALTNLLQVSQRDGARYPISYFHLGRLYESKGELKLAEAAFSQAANTYQPTNPQFLLDLSRVREKLGDFKGALDAMEQYLKLMQAQGQKPVWCDERIAELRTKAAQK